MFGKTIKQMSDEELAEHRKFLAALTVQAEVEFMARKYRSEVPAFKIITKEPVDGNPENPTAPRT